MRLVGSVSVRPLDWRIGVYLERGTLGFELLHIVMQVPMIRLWIGVYKQEGGPA